ncbi:beta-ketoacyl-[acyl-carrier-protein] synthase family protein [Psychromonas sp. RZ22]|uniref:beta-ketoacyl-[acyl-carrier-protein] synthase family protein n=1 Tax=Psychromonas algarum TaxID=2555643 RepID=UPI0010684B95|nr:beta-ketoacyl-[acyl-carrier-protein] synthase family protein [Psychromonas sp. RZ22]TEW54091.1 beta-ketoacyl-[acyl-carrier-protein] synthase family protein [Psychromonas sp. RZ22]
MDNTQDNAIYIHAMAMNSALGDNTEQQISTLLGKTPAAMCSESGWLNDGKATVVGKVLSELPIIPAHFINKNTHNNRLALSALLSMETSIKEAIEQFGAERIAVVVGTSTSGISDGESALNEGLSVDYHYHQQEVGNLGQFVADYFSIEGPAYTISTACSSSARVFISAKRLLNAGLVDAVIVGGSDSLCRLTLNGFHGLEALSSEACLPFSQNRKGINIGEAAAFMLLSKQKNTTGLALLGVGDSSDAHHISAPHPEGKGAIEAMQKALDDAHLTVDDIGYINAHGTATKLNDAMESKAIYTLFKDTVPVSSTKPLTGHTLGAASILEASICCLLLAQDMTLPVQINDGEFDPTLAPIQFVNKPEKLQKKILLSNSFAFGGNNMSLIFGIKNDQ